MFSVEEESDTNMMTQVVVLDFFSSSLIMSFLSMHPPNAHTTVLFPFVLCFEKKNLTKGKSEKRMNE